MLKQIQSLIEENKLLRKASEDHEILTKVVRQTECKTEKIMEENERLSQMVVDFQ